MKGKISFGYDGNDGAGGRLSAKGASRAHPESDLCTWASGVGRGAARTGGFFFFCNEKGEASLLLHVDSGGDLLSRAVTSQVPSALKGLTAVFGMGTGGTPSSLSPEMVNCFILSSAALAASDCRIVAQHVRPVKTFHAPPSLRSDALPRPDNCTVNDSSSDLQLISKMLALNQALDLLVSSSCMCYHTSTDDLSTW